MLVISELFLLMCAPVSGLREMKLHLREYKQIISNSGRRVKLGVNFVLGTEGVVKLPSQLKHASCFN